MSTSDKNSKVRIPELVNRVATDSGKSKASSKRLIKALLAAVQDGLVKDGLVRLDGFGSFALQWHAGRTTKHPKTGEPVEIPGQTRVIFRPSVMLRRQVNTEYQQIVVDVIPDKLEEIIEALDLPENIELPPVIIAPDSQDDAPEKTTVNNDNENGIQKETHSVTTFLDAESISGRKIKDAPNDSSEIEQTFFDKKSESFTEKNVAPEDKISPHAPASIDPTKGDDPENVTQDELDDRQGSASNRIVATEVDADDENLQIPDTIENEENNETNFSASKNDEEVLVDAGANLPVDAVSLPEPSGLISVEVVSDEKPVIIEYPVTQSDDAELENQYTSFQEIEESDRVFRNNAPITIPELQNEMIPPFDAEVPSVSENVGVNDEDLSHAPNVDGLAWMDVSEVEKPLRRPIPKRHTRSSVPQIITGAVGVTAALVFGNMLLGPMLNSDDAEPETVQNTSLTASTPEETLSSTKSGLSNRPPAVPQSFKEANLRVTEQEVSAGDNLWNMAEEKYTDPTLWPVIYGVNQEKLSNPDQIVAGESVDIPSLDLNTENLSAKDKRILSLGYLRVYQAYEQAGNAAALDYLKIANQYDPGLIQENQDHINQYDLRQVRN